MFERADYAALPARTQAFRFVALLVERDVHVVPSARVGAQLPIFVGPIRRVSQRLSLGQEARDAFARLCREITLGEPRDDAMTLAAPSLHGRRAQRDPHCDQDGPWGLHICLRRLRIRARRLPRWRCREQHHSHFVTQASWSVLQLARQPSSLHFATQVVFVSSQLLVHVLVVVVVVVVVVELPACAPLPAWLFESLLVVLHFFTQSS